MLKHAFKLFAILFLFFTFSAIQSQSCADGTYSWDDDIAVIMAPCTGCHGGTSGLSLDTYAGIAAGGTQCATDDLLTGGTLIQIITSDNTMCAGGTINNSMNSNCGNCISAGELSAISAWISDGAQEACPLILPVEYSAMEAKAEGQDIVISWTTSVEINSSEFEVYHSTDLIEYNSVSKVEAARNSNTEIDYEVRHRAPQPGLHYYRVVQTDQDGTEHAGQILSVRHYPDTNNVLSLHPNPSTESTNVVFDYPLNKSFTIMLIDIYGQVMVNKTMPAETSRMINLDTSVLPSGTYRLLVHVDNHSSFTKKLIKI